MNINTKPWYAIKEHDPRPGSEESGKILDAISAVLSVQEDAQQRWMMDDFCASWFYQRDYMSAQYDYSLKNNEGIPQQISNYRENIADDFGFQSPSIVKSIVKTIVAWLFSETPPLGVKASGATFEMRKALDQYGVALDSILNTPENADTLRVAARDGILKGFGAAWVQLEDGKLVIKRLHRRQVQYDPYDARDGHPRCIYISEWRDRDSFKDWLKAFGESTKHLSQKLKRIDKLSTLTGYTGSDNQKYWTLYDWELNGLNVPDTTQRIEIVHCFRLASSADANDGRHTVIARGAAYGGEKGGVILTDIPTSLTSFPVVWWTPDPNDQGIRGSGFYHDLIKWQSAIDRHMYKIQKTADKFGWEKVAIPPGAAKLTEAFFEGGIYPIEIAGGQNLPKSIGKAIPLSSEDIMWVDKLMTMSMNMVGVNQLMAQGGSRLGAGASAVALVEENYRSTDRFSDVLRRWQRFLIDLGRQVLFALDAAIDQDKHYSASFEYKGDQTRVKWADLRKQTGNYVVDVEMRGEMAGSRAGRMAKIIDLAARNLIDESVAQEMMMSTPDVRKAARLSLAGTRLVEWQLENYIQNEKIPESTPSQEMDEQTLAVAIDRATKYLYLAQVEGANEETITRLRRYKQTAESILRDKTPPPPPQGPQGVPPEMMAEQPPTLQ